MRTLPVLCVLSLLSVAFETSAADCRKVESKIDALMRAQAASHRVNGVYAIYHGETRCFLKAYGQANFENEIPNTVDTKFLLASLTKRFTAIAILILEQEGLLKTTDSASKYMSEVPKRMGKITIDHLLHHTSGLARNEDLDAELLSSPRTSIQLLSTKLEAAPKTPPGIKFVYSNLGYQILAAIVEKVSGKTYEQFLSEKIWAPLGMKNTGVKRAELVPGQATSYTLKKGKLIVEKHSPHPSFALGSGNLYSTVEDLHKLNRALHAPGPLLKSAQWKKMVTPGPGKYGCGVEVRSMEDPEGTTRTAYVHRGSMPGVSTFNAQSEDGWELIFLNNTRGPKSDAGAGKLLRRLVKLLMRD